MYLRKGTSFAVLSVFCVAYLRVTGQRFSVQPVNGIVSNEISVRHSLVKRGRVPAIKQIPQLKRTQSAPARTMAAQGPTVAAKNENPAVPASRNAAKKDIAPKALKRTQSTPARSMIPFSAKSIWRADATTKVALDHLAKHSQLYKAGAESSIELGRHEINQAKNSNRRNGAYLFDTAWQSKWKQDFNLQNRIGSLKRKQAVALRDAGEASLKAGKRARSSELMSEAAQAQADSLCQDLYCRLAQKRVKQQFGEQRAARLSPRPNLSSFQREMLEFDREHAWEVYESAAKVHDQAMDESIALLQRQYAKPGSAAENLYNRAMRQQIARIPGSRAS